MKKIIAAAATMTGRRRNNQDNFMLNGRFAELDHGTFSCKAESESRCPFFAAVCDGMGGEASGERASYEACAVLADAAHTLSSDFSANKAAVSNAILNANDRLCEIMQSGDGGRMGSTVCAALIQNDKLFYTNLGDSRIYLYRNGRLIQITRDHSEGQTMVDAGILTQEQLKTHPSRNKLNRHLGIFKEEMILECPVYEDIPLLGGDKVFICSDGVFGALDNEKMISIISEPISVGERVKKLIDSAFEHGSTDNMTALIIEVERASSSKLPLTLIPVIAVAAVGLFIAVKGLLNQGSNGQSEHTDIPQTTIETSSEPSEEPSITPLATPSADSETQSSLPIPSDPPMVVTPSPVEPSMQPDTTPTADISTPPPTSLIPPDGSQPPLTAAPFETEPPFATNAPVSAEPIVETEIPAQSDQPIETEIPDVSGNPIETEVPATQFP